MTDSTDHVDLIAIGDAISRLRTAASGAGMTPAMAKDTAALLEQAIGEPVMMMTRLEAAEFTRGVIGSRKTDYNDGVRIGVQLGVRWVLRRFAAIKNRKRECCV